MIDAQGRIRDLSESCPIFTARRVIAERPFAKLGKLKPEEPPAEVPRHPAARRVHQQAPGNFIAIGLNYSDHAAETGSPPAEGADHFQQGAEQHLRPERRHHNSEGARPTRLGSRTRHRDRKPRALPVQRQGARRCRRLLSRRRRLRADVSDQARRTVDQGQEQRDVRPARSTGWCRRDEIKSPQNLDMWLDVNGEKRQRGNTSTMIFDCRHIVWACSQYFVLEPGDVIITGTPRASRSA